jgi:hypothetical protein
MPFLAPRKWDTAQTSNKAPAKSSAGESELIKSIHT